jgi:hypothetical protein
MEKREQNRSSYLYDKYNHIIKSRDDPILKTGIIDLNVDKIHPSKLNYGESAEFVLMVAINALKISRKYNKENFIVFCDMRKSSIKNFSYKFIKYIDAIVMKALPYRLGVAYFILGKSSNYALLYQAFYKIAHRIIHPETLEKFKLLYK